MADDISELEYIIHHVFCPPKLPQKDDSSPKHDQALCELVLEYASEFRRFLPGDALQSNNWDVIINMLNQLCESVRFQTLSAQVIKQQIQSMQPADFLVYLIRAQNAAAIIRKNQSDVTFELFEVSPTAAAVTGAKGKLLCSYPGPAITVPSDIVDDLNFTEELASFLSHMNDDVPVDAAPTTTKAQSTINEDRETTNPRYITELLTGILRGIGRIADVPRIQKRIRDEVLWDRAPLPWRRSPLWLVIRVALQTTLAQESGGVSDYKSFMVYFMTHILVQGVQSDLPSDLLHCMRAKVCRRIHKHSASAPYPLLDLVKRTAEEVQGVLQTRWNQAQEEQAEPFLWAPDELDIMADTTLSLPNSRRYLTDVLSQQANPTPPLTWQPPNCPRRHDISEFIVINGDCPLSSASKIDPYVVLADFETSIRDGIDGWISHITPDVRISACLAISECMAQYSKQAQEHYKDSPEDLSIMLLTLLDLWVALDKLSIQEHAMLSEYSPEIPVNLPDSLLIRRADSLARVDRIQKYLSHRHDRTHSQSVFSEKVQSDNFAVRFFDSSQIHISLKERIESDAHIDRNKKLKELLEKNARHASLSDQARRIQHDYQMNGAAWSNPIHIQSCRRCKLDKSIRKIRIDLHEWPLPKDLLLAKMVVFEMDPPVAFSVWRSATYNLLVDVCTPPENRLPPASPHSTLINYPALYKYVTRPLIGQISIASSSKPFIKSHYRNVGVPTTEGKVCVNNGLSFKLYDMSGDRWVAKSFVHCNRIARFSTFILPDGPYSNLQSELAKTSHTHNEVIAKQSNCHQDLNIHEFLAFGSLRSGPLLQWLNVVREIRARCLSFRREEVCALVMQAAWQIGPLRNGKREWHEELEKVEFGHALLRELEGLMNSIEENWLECASMRTVVVLACRLLTSTLDEEVQNNIFALLRHVRNVTFRCVQQLSQKLREAEDNAEISEFQCRVRDMAATCRATYDVETTYLPTVLSSPEDDFILIRCAVIIYDNLPSKVDEVPMASRLLLYRDRRLSHSLEGIVSRRMDYDTSGLDRAVTSAWPAYRPGDFWYSLDYPQNSWFICYTAKESNQLSQCVHYNILEGRLLVGGRPLGRLPLTFIQHPAYYTIFGQKVLDVVPADLPGMEFATNGYVSGYRVYFSMEGDSDLVIRAVKCGHTYELIPPKLFLNDLPKLLVDGHIHWLNLSNREIEFRPISALWDTSPSNWRIVLLKSSSSFMTRTGVDAKCHYMVDIGSRSHRMVSNCLNKLEYPEYHIITATSDGLLSIDLPRFGLSFFLNDDNHLQCRNIRDMVVDTDQSTGTLIGLRNQLVLRPGDSRFRELPRSRCVVIAQGQISVIPESHHVHIEIDTNERSRVQFHLYKIDGDLGCLVGNVNLTNKLYKAYLHAVSSHCLPDPLTGRTGVEEALHSLQSASCLSFQGLSSTDVELLCQIGSLSSFRNYYPKGRKFMETVEWSDCLAPTTQHYGFYVAAKSILDYAEKLNMFHENPQTLPQIPCESYLLERAFARNAMFYPEEYARPFLSACQDVQYASRHLCGDEESSVFDTASMVHRWPSKLETVTNLLEHFIAWGRLDVLDGSIADLQYYSSWLHISLPSAWLSVFNLCRTSEPRTRQYQLLFSLSAMTYTSPESRDFIPTLLSFATIRSFEDLKPPPYDLYDLASGFTPDLELSECVRSTALPFESSEEFFLQPFVGESESSFHHRRLAAYDQRQHLHLTTMVARLLIQWPCEEPHIPVDYSASFDIVTLTEQVQGLFSSCYRNMLLKRHTEEVQAILDEVYFSRSRTTVAYNLAHPQYMLTPRAQITSFRDLLAREAPRINFPAEPLGIPGSSIQKGQPSKTEKLRELLSEFEKDPVSRFHKAYGQSLDQSRRILSEQTLDTFPAQIPYSVESLHEYCRECGDRFRSNLQMVQQALLPQTDSDHATFLAGQWPRIAARSILEKLGTMSSYTLSTGWRQAIISLSISLLQLQRAQRLLSLAIRGRHEEIFKELENTGCDGWDPMEYPDWLLVQVENHFLIRRIQADVALEMICPKSQENTTLQLNMGEGKSSVIVPIAAAALGSGDKLVRVIILKSLAVQMFQLLVERLSGLTNRRVYYLPFSRSIKLNAANAARIHNLYEECRRIGGIWVAQPDHILSYKLMGIDRRLSSKSPIAEELLKSQQWLETHSRDILDESDEVLHVRYQLVYTIGLQNPLEGYPDRWTTVQQLFGLVKQNIRSVLADYPLGVDVRQTSPGGFPTIRILQDDAGTALVSILVERILDGELPNYNFIRVPATILKSISAFLKLPDLSPVDAETLKLYCNESGLWKGLLLLRGMLAKGVLVYVLKERRWRVDYGLDLRRSMLAVPYRAKDVPALRAEFGHGDVATALTCLSYYYGGLSGKQLDACFELLEKSDNPDLEYETWIEGYDRSILPESLCNLSGVNTRSTEQRNKYLVPLFQYNRVIIDFYLANVVFPAQSKGFPRKLGTSGWDVAERKTHVVTGFSGTNDNQYLLPISIKQHDPTHQRSTNAKVLNYLLQDENNHYLTANMMGERASTEGFLTLLVEQSPEIRVLLDVGAQMLELHNDSLAKLWLSLKPQALAAIYFNENDELTVVDRDGNVESFITSPFNQQIDQCLLYLDDAHTRGTDVKLPSSARAAVTLGPKVTKDRLIQGCMRMRQLGDGHSVMFFAPKEVDRSIRAAATRVGKEKSPTEMITTQDILRWTMLETCADIQHRASQWAEQGADHRDRANALSRFLKKEMTADNLAKVWLQQESWSLQEMYGVSSTQTHPAFKVPELRKRCLELGVATLTTSQMDEEQEREVVHEVERERQVARPPKVKAAKHKVHPEVRRFVQNGVIAVYPEAFKPAFTTLRHTTAGFKQADAWSPHLLVTEDFITTVDLQSKYRADDFLRSCNWIVSCRRNHTLVLVIFSPFEVHTLLPEIRASQHVQLHLYTPRVTKAMRSSDDLTFYTVSARTTRLDVPMPLKIQLGILSGQLFLPDPETYVEFCRFLGIYTKDLGQNVIVQSDGFIKPKDRPINIRSLSPFNQSPMLSLKALIGLRRKGMGYQPTHIGKILQVRHLSGEDFVA